MENVIVQLKFKPKNIEIENSKNSNYHFEEIESRDELFLTDSSADDLLSEIRTKNNKIRLWVLWTIFSTVMTFFNAMFMVRYAFKIMIQQQLSGEEILTVYT